MLASHQNTIWLGHRVILPPSHTGSPQFSQQLYQDSMAIVRHNGTLTLFITITANPNRIEVREVLEQDDFGLTAFDWPDVVNWVIQLKVDTLVLDHKTHHIIGKEMAHCYRLKYQKWGLPHVHLLLFLHENHSYIDPTSIDRIILAAFPDKNEKPGIYEMISSSMVHGLCGDKNPKCLCMTSGHPYNKKCRKSFPKAFSEQMLLTDNDYPVYCKWAGMGNSMTIQNHRNLWQPMVTDYRWVISCSPSSAKNAMPIAFQKSLVE